jgi:DNA-directed RNA polymerase subunit RPC12/RpoP
MAVPENEYIVLPETIDGKKRGERWVEVLRRWLVKCPQCSEVRLVVGAHEDDEYVCKNCGHRFTIKFSVTTKELR